tara:strand:- start:391 stop:549 length:159 start_codon:yes stop_codon:yes gene_type:complete
VQPSAWEELGRNALAPVRNLESQGCGGDFRDCHWLKIRSRGGGLKLKAAMAL